MPTTLDRQARPFLLPLVQSLAAKKLSVLGRKDRNYLSILGGDSVGLRKSSSQAKEQAYTICAAQKTSRKPCRVTTDNSGSSALWAVERRPGCRTQSPRASICK